MKRIKKEEIKTSEWSGGTTRELLVYPNHTSYENRDFTYRFSTASVDQETSEFTRLTGYMRYLMVLEGEMYIEHFGQHHLEMKAFDVDIFDGGLTTSSKGKVKDFNLMTSHECDGILSVVKDFKEVRVATEDNEHLLVYVYKGALGDLEAGDVLFLDRNENHLLTNHNEETVLIVGRVIF